MKRFFILNVIIFTATVAALACGPWVRPNYYVFSAYNRTQLGLTFTPRMMQFWIDYTGNQYATGYVDDLAWVDPNEFEQSDNLIVRHALDTHDTEMEQYLRLLVAYLRDSGSIDDDNWQYPTRKQVAERDARMRYIHGRATAYTGTRLLPQYRLLAMRTLMAQGDTQGVINYWRKAEATTPEGVYRDMMRNIYAGALLRTGKRAEACDIYAEQGDMLSLKWIMRDNRDLNGLRSEYARDPNAPTLVYLVQDFVNVGSQTLNAQYEYDWDNPAYVDASRREMQQFIAMAQQVVSEGKTRCPALWQSAAGYLTCQLGDTPAGLAMLDKAMKMKGTDRMRDNARLCRWVASLKQAENTAKWQDYFLGELKWVLTAEKKEIEQYDFTLYSYGAMANHYTEVLSNVMYDIMPPKALSWGNATLAAAMKGWMSDHEMQLIHNFDKDEDYHASSNDYLNELDSLTAHQMIDYRDYLTTGKGATTALERYLNAGTTQFMTADYFNDRIGTKFIRQGLFEDALPYLEAVPLSYIGNQTISYYMARRDFEVPRWLKRQVVCRSEWGYCDETPTPVTSNQKLDFCRKMISLENVIENPDEAGISVCEAAYQMAALLYQASYRGDCWYISRYGQSSYDKCCYRNELDFVARAALLLDRALDWANLEPGLRAEILYARAFVPSGSTYITRTWNEDFTMNETRDTDSREYTTMADLANFYRSNKKTVPNYVSNCDVLRRFLAGGTAYTGQWPDFL